MNRIDQFFLDRFNENRFPHQKQFWKTMADARWLAGVLYVLPSLYLLLIRQVVPVIIMSVGTLACLIVGYGLKAIILRPRPNNFVTYLGKKDSSFPSLHTLCAWNLALILSIYLPALTILWLIIAMCIGISRIYIQVHYFTDVVGGIILGYIISTSTTVIIESLLITIIRNP